MMAGEAAESCRSLTAGATVSSRPDRMRATLVAVPWDHIINPARRVIYMRMWGAVKLADFHAAQSALKADLQFDPSFSGILDLLDGVSLDVSASDIAQLANRTIFQPSARRAIVGNNDPTFGLARMFEIQRGLVDASSSGQIYVFRTLPEALTWLGLDDADLRTG
jgi:hypothetical protein